MAQSVSNDALWEKLLEMDRKLDELPIRQKTEVSKQPDEEISPSLQDRLLSSISEKIHILGLSNDSHFAANRQNIETMNGNIIKILTVANRIRKQQRESVEAPKPEDAPSCFNLLFFKVRKTSFVITILRLLVFILTLFCMKQQDDYSLLNNEYHRQEGIIKEMQVKTDSLINREKATRMKSQAGYGK